MEYKAIKMTIRRGANGNNIHPSGHDGYKIDGLGIGMHYSELDWDENNCRYAVTILPVSEADEYIAASNGDVVAISEHDAEVWFAEHKASEPEEILNNGILQSIVLKKQLGITLSKADEDALDPNNPKLGINKFPKGFRAKLPKTALIV